jgi:SAM-dependent methyltransferase
MAQQDELRAGGQDWAAVWRDMYEAERKQVEAVTPAEFQTPADYWARTARRFAAAAKQNPQPDGFLRFVLPRLRSTDRVVDIGAGSGRYLPHLSAAVREVVAVEPSPAMRAELEALVAEHGLANVQVVAAGWPEAQLEPVDVAISAHVLYSVADAEPFLHAMDAVARRACYLHLFFQHPISSLCVFWERLRGEQRLRLPSALEALCLLRQMGLRAGLQPVPLQSTLRYADADEALDDLRWRLRCLPDPARDALLKQAINELMLRDGEGLVPPGLPDEAAVVWWERGDG